MGIGQLNFGVGNCDTHVQKNVSLRNNVISIFDDFGPNTGFWVWLGSGRYAIHNSFMHSPVFRFVFVLSCCLLWAKSKSPIGFQISGLRFD